MEKYSFSEDYLQKSVTVNLYQIQSVISDIKNESKELKAGTWQLHKQ